ADRAEDSAAGLEAQFRKLRRLAAAGVAADDQHPMPLQRFENIATRARDRQLVGILEPEGRAAPPLDEPPRLGEPLRQAPAQLRSGLPGALALADRGEQVRQVPPVLQCYRIDARSELACGPIAQPVRPPRRRGRARCESP